MCRLFPSLFLLWAIINSGHSINQPVFGLNEMNPTKVAATDIEKHDQSVSERGDNASQHLWSAAAALFITSLLAASFTALKIFVAQTLLVSKMSLVGAALLAMKAAYDHLKHKFQNSRPMPWDSHPSEVFVTPWAWEHASLPISQDQEEHQDLQAMTSGNAKTHGGLVGAESDPSNVSVRSDRLKQTYPPKLSMEFDTVIKKTTYLD